MKINLGVLLLALVLVAGCTTTVMVDPETGATAKCEPRGNGFFDVQSCVKDYEALGWRKAR